MPQIAVAPQTLAVASLTPEASGGAAVAATGEMGAATFASLLQQRFAGMTVDAVDNRLAQLLTAAEADPASAGTLIDASVDTSLSALLPMLTAKLAGTAGNGRADDTDTTNGIADPVAIAAPAMAAPAAATQIAAPTAVPDAPAQANVDIPMKTPAGTATANLAAAPDIAAPKAAAGDNFAALVAAAGNEPPGATIATAAHAAIAHGVPEHAAPAAGTAIATAVGAPGWDNEVGNHVAWMAGNQVGRAELVLTPPHLGRIEISLTVNGDQATATFVSASPAVREAIENAVPRLREILADAGVTLGQTQVGADTPQQSPGEGGNDSMARVPMNASGVAGLTTGGADGIAWTRSGRGLVDVFA